MSQPLQYLQNTFAGGLNQQVDSSRLKANEFPLLINGRNRYDTIDQINAPVDVTPAAILNIQGLYAAGAYSVLFAYGKAFYKNEGVVGSQYQQIVGFQMSPTAAILHACPVPASTINGTRKLGAATNVNGAILLTGQSSSSPQALVVQDGVSQPWLIFADGTARVSGNYNQWTQAVREYIPIGKQMLHHGGILYIVSPDGLEIYRSVTGRPVDFMVIINEAGDKLPAETDGGAAQIGHKIDYAPITAISALSAPDGDFYVSTARTSYAIRPMFDVLPYGEPSFANIFLFSTGAVNNFSVCDILGDSAIVDYSGIRSFNSVGQYRLEGKNSPFSAKVGRLIAGIKQTSPAAVSFDNYGLFAVDTIFGRGILVYDTLTQQWSSLDLLPELASEAILMFCVVKTDVSRKVLCATASRVFELYPETGIPEVTGYYTPEFNSNDPAISQKATYLQLGFVDVLSPGSVWALPIADGKAGVQKSSRVINVSADATVATQPPVLYRSSDKVRTVTIPFLDTAKSCWKFGVYIRWNFVGKLNSVKLIANAESSLVSIEEQIASVDKNTLQIIAVAIGELAAGAIIDLFGVGFEGVMSITVNGFIITDFEILADGWIRFHLPADWPAGVPPFTIIVTTGKTIFVWSGSIAEDDIRDNPTVIYIDPADINFDQTPVDVVSDIELFIKDIPVFIGSGDQPPPTVVDVVSVTNDSLGDCECTFNITSSVVIPLTPRAVYDVGKSSTQVAGFVPGYMLHIESCVKSKVVFAALMFQREADGSFTFVTPIWAGEYSGRNFDDFAARSLLGKSFTGADGVVKFGLYGQVFCVSFPFTPSDIINGGGIDPTFMSVNFQAGVCASFELLPPDAGGACSCSGSVRTEDGLRVYCTKTYITEITQLQFNAQTGLFTNNAVAYICSEPGYEEPSILYTISFDPATFSFRITEASNILYEGPGPFSSGDMPPVTIGGIAKGYRFSA